MNISMRTIPFDLFPANEHEDFLWWCSRAGKSQSEFIVRAEQEDAAPDSPQPTRREVIVKHLPSGHARRYGASHGTNWISSFLDDLQAGFYVTGIRTG
jgi:hypothetical protein